MLYGKRWFVVLSYFWSNLFNNFLGNILKEIKKEIHFPHSLGLLYSAFTYYTGFKVNSGEYKLMGLAPYGVPIYEDKIKSNLKYSICINYLK